MEKCGTCKYWNNTFEKINKNPDYCKCNKLSNMVETIQCVIPIFGLDVDEDVSEDYLETGKEFGCIHHESI